jgi:uncharacterized protein (DUF1778 family)
MRAYFGLVISTFILSAAFAAAQSQIPADDRVLGTWVLVIEKSRFDPGPPPRSQTRTYQAHPDGVKATIRTVAANGNTTNIQYTAKYDSVEYPVLGSVDSDAITLKRIDEFTAEANLGHAGKVIGTAKRVISKDGKTMTISYRGTAEGLQVSNVSVYELRP